VLVLAPSIELSLLRQNHSYTSRREAKVLDVQLIRGLHPMRCSELAEDALAPNIELLLLGEGG